MKEEVRQEPLLVRVGSHKHLWLTRPEIKCKGTKITLELLSFSLTVLRGPKKYLHPRPHLDAWSRERLSAWLQAIG